MVTSSSSTNIQRKMAKLVMNKVEKDFLIEKKLREMRLELIAVHKEREKEIEELKMRTGNLVAEGQVRTLKKVQGRDLERIMRLYIMVNKSHLSIREKKLFVGNMELYNHQLGSCIAAYDMSFGCLMWFFANQPNETDMNDLESDDESVDTPLASPFPHSDNDLDDGEVLNELSEYENARVLCRQRAINSIDGDDIAFQCMIGFRKFVAYFDPFLPMNIITRKAYNTIMVEGLESIGKNLVAIVWDVYVFVGSFTYITDFVILEDIGEFILSNMAQVVMGKPFRKITKLEYDCTKGLMSFTRMFDNNTFQMPRTIPRKLFKENKKKIFTVAGDGVRVYPDGVVIFDEKKLVSS
ncbi:hypothetical protein Tco_0706935 [Tanacetum coccineum]|uniref:Protein kinase-like domain, concanavalin A-like lectin/glucanase domain protein n=1 Tax=Tanacetum coccineum TaxID=301880 RepID=A0ABQ4Y8S4_9ASTR